MATVPITSAAKADAAQALYERYYANVYRYALSQLRSPQDAEDAAQNTFLRAFAALQKGIVPENEVAWLFKIAHNVCSTSKLAWLRRRRVEAPRDLDALPVEPSSPESRRDELAGLQDALAAMPPRLREAFLLREWQGLSYAEIAERLDTSHSAVETLIFRARKMLAQQLEQPMKRVREALGIGPLLNLLRGMLEAAPTIAKAAGVVAVAAGATVAAKPLVTSDRPASAVPAGVSTAPAPATPAPGASTESRPGPHRAARQRTAGPTPPRSTPVPSQPRVPLAPGAPPIVPATPAPAAAPSTPVLGPVPAPLSAAPVTPVPLNAGPATPVTSLVPALAKPPVGPVATPSLPLPSAPVTAPAPAVKSPPVTTPPIAAQPVTTPPITTSPITTSLPVTPPPSSPGVPTVPVPQVTVPQVTVPQATVPQVTSPPATTPTVTIPGSLP
jgi:RNA polymerase sigma factor (sigma-70 family)